MTNTLRDAWQSFSVNPKRLVEGTNVIATEVHLASTTATNMAFDLQLIATDAPFISSIVRTSNPAIFLVGSGNAPTTVQATADFLTWTNLGSLRLTNGAGIFSDASASNAGARFYRAVP